MQDWARLRNSTIDHAWPAVTFGAALAGAFVVRHLALRALRRKASSAHSFPAVMADTIGTASVFWCLVFALRVSLQVADLTVRQIWWASAVIGASVIVSMTLVLSAIVERSITNYGARQSVPIAVAGLSRTLIRIVVATLGLIALAVHFDLTPAQITPLLTALGVGGLAVALALQDTLANFFAGVHILLERPIFVGDFIKLDSGQEGVVSDIGWRTTRVRLGSNDIVVVPNTKITSGILVNYNLPEPRCSAEIVIMTAHEADPDEVCRIAVEEALQVAGVLADPAPACQCNPGVLPTHIEYKLFVNVAKKQDQWSVQSAIRMRLLRRFRAEGIALPCIPDAALATAARR
ncbi:MAG TPA: mechanosensitive ion channel family protein [Bryobacteraceae bacterium]|nr:mechanosensitive ion channel family protein [Bryobacteraceae bacterium]